MSENLGRALLIGRQREQQVLTELLTDARQGRSGVIAIRGEAGIGKTALLADAVQHAVDFQVIALNGAESEMELAYAGVQQLCAPLLAGVDRLPQRQKLALQVALGLRENTRQQTPEHLMVGLALLTLLSEASSSRPILCVIDDAQWVDAASITAFGFVARQVFSDPLVMMFAARGREPEGELAGLPELGLTGLGDADARALLATMVPGRFDEHVRETVIAEAGGNPLALLELHGAIDADELAGGYGLVNATSRTSLIVSSFERRVRQLPPQTAGLLLVAATEPAARPEWLWAAARGLGIDVGSAEPAVAAGLVTVDDGIRFSHPLIRSAVYRSAPLSERRRAHAALARSILGSDADDRRAWHRARAASRPDERLAAELVASSHRARARGGVAAAAAFLAYAADLTPDPSSRAHRLLDAASAKLDAGAPAAASQLMVRASADSDAESVMARIALLRAKLAFAIRRGRDAPRLLLTAAERLTRVDPPLARETYLEALMASLAVGRSAADPHDSPRFIAEAARHAPPAVSPSRAIDLMLDGLIIRFTEGYRSAAPLLRRALDEFLHEDAAGTADPRWHVITHRVCLDLFDHEASNLLATHQIEMLSTAGELTILPAVYYQSAALCVMSGRFEAAAGLIGDADAIVAATGAPPHSAIRAYLAAHRGQEALCHKLLQLSTEEATARGEGAEITVAQWSKAILYNGLGQYAEALVACRSVTDLDDLGLYGYMLVEMVEAATRCGDEATAVDALAQLHERAAASRTETALGLAARSAALVNGDSPSAETDYRHAISHLDATDNIVFQARTHLVYGEWLRRAQRTRAAQRHLRIARDMFVDIGAGGFGERTRRELTAAGTVVSTEAAGATIDLTAQESHIARLVRDGYTTPEVAERLFLSPRTVEWHLRNIFTKLGISSRRELRSSTFDSSA
ncbi:MAG: AAA family ATPase [Mycobacterium sp.]